VPQRLILRRECSMNRRFLTIVACIATAVLCASRPSCGGPQEVRDSADLERIREIFGIPEDFELVSYDGYPSSVGFGQREGLELSAVFQLTGGQAHGFVADRLASGWSELPMPEGVVASIPFRGLPVPVDALQGVYICLTAGDDVLYARETRPVAEGDRINDLILGVLDTTEDRLYVMVRSAY
jgi:hypothetical protein